ncbi:hypothetical protein CFC21_037168 [Triticum aestivum]|uniref:Uncharacterized protein n=3 Tax=Triticum TaxID=4564 RepID=A0A9R0VPX9_TRITD|nr:hypothetical protein CFC21_037168 [Triticum aestivum]VAH66652.1 unnamed protein product [Triticum turgidum subsp. durum]
MMIVDLGCSTGPNALALVSITVEAIHANCLQFQQPPPEVCVLLNDLPENDFNTVVKSLVTLRQSSDPVAVTGITPGSFYERLFTSESLHLVCSSNSLHWLSKAPEDLTKNLIPAYDIDEHSRHERLFPCKELREIIQEEGSFSIREMRAHDPRTDMNNALSTPGRFTRFLRALFEPVLVQHFGDVMDEFVKTTERRWVLEGSLQEERARCPYAMLVVSLAKA